jgi:hypothetical protein
MLGKPLSISLPEVAIMVVGLTKWFDLQSLRNKSSQFAMKKLTAAIDKEVLGASG